ncbi:MAG TPA: nuclear transport factor 2 family protein [Actinomycetota bacterium]|nr:nuclear transport factor 2 family protein [Actinomycetota bacterium]
MDRHPFEEVSATDPSAERFSELLAPDVVFHSPVFVHPVTGRDPVAEILETVHGIFGRPTYRLRLRDGPHTVLLFDGEVEGQVLQAAVVLREDPTGLIGELTVLMRPLPVVRRFAEQALRRLGLTGFDDIPGDG